MGLRQAVILAALAAAAPATADAKVCRLAYTGPIAVASDLHKAPLAVRASGWIDGASGTLTLRHTARGITFRSLRVRALACTYTYQNADVYGVGLLNGRRYAYRLAIAGKVWHVTREVLLWVDPDLSHAAPTASPGERVVVWAFVPWYDVTLVPPSE